MGVAKGDRGTGVCTEVYGGMHNRVNSRVQSGVHSKCMGYTVGTLKMHAEHSGCMAGAWWEQCGHRGCTANCMLQRTAVAQ